MNSRIVEKILSHQSTPRTAFKTRIYDWHQLETINSPPVTFARLALANLHYGPFGDLLEGSLPTDMCGYNGLCHYSQYGQLLQDPSLFLIPLVPALVSATAIVDSAGSSIEGDAKTTAGNRTDAGSGLGGDARDNGSAVVDAGNRTDVGLALGGDVEEDGSVVVDDGLAARDNRLAARDDRLAVGDDGLAVDNDRSAAGIDKKRM